jgi:hypothetical protein
VYPVKLTGVDFVCVKDGRVSLVAVADGEDPSPILGMLRSAGLDVKVEGAPANPRHNGYRVMKSISVKPEDKQCLEKLLKMLERQDKTLSAWFSEQMFEYVSRGMNV